MDEFLRSEVNNNSLIFVGFCYLGKDGLSSLRHLGKILFLTLLNYWKNNIGNVMTFLKPRMSLWSRWLVTKIIRTEKNIEMIIFVGIFKKMWLIGISSFSGSSSNSGQRRILFIRVLGKISYTFEILNYFRCFLFA